MSNETIKFKIMKKLLFLLVLAVVTNIVSGQQNLNRTEKVPQKSSGSVWIQWAAGDNRTKVHRIKYWRYHCTTFKPMEPCSKGFMLILTEPLEQYG